MQFSLALMKQKKLEEKQLIIALCKEHTMRKRPMYDWSFNSKIAIIAEVKKASPSKGIIKIVDPAEQAVRYQQAGAKAISVLTDSHYFGGSFDDLCHVANAVTLPVLCKEFICYTEQIDAAYLCGADSVLLINAMLTASELKTLYDYTIAKHLTPLIEIHALSELDTVLTLKP
ncbi:MAG TPA: indole-3-glycerol phosphate synthase TrpC, partial [Spirochaetota bacterium]|nr:indole-3-glycerol phosphate synthase TrpC [Spirochaetota bacterium]HRV16000.1 indole-3-glycerol phosphate synthase TrpC [Spirochaetota bacterium]